MNNLNTKVSLRKRLLIFIFIIIIQTCLISISLNLNTRSVTNKYDERIHAISLINDIKINISDGYYLLQEYQLTENGEYKDKLYKINNNIKNKLNELSFSLGSNTSKLIFININNIFEKYNEKNNLMIVELNYSDIINYDLYSQTLEYNKYLDTLLSKLVESELEYNNNAYKILKKNTNSILDFIFIIIILLFGVCIIYAVNYSNDIYIPIQRLVKGASDLAKGNFNDEDIKVERLDEIGYLTKIFNKMKRDINKSIKETENKAKIEALLKDAELRALQSQMNPHFLFNSLSMVIESALVEGADETLSMIEEISYILRYSISSFNTKVTLKDEIKMTSNYISLQSKRFDDRIRFIVRIPDNIPKIEVPGMVIQPIIENAVIHGLESKIDGGTISITLYNNLNNIVVIIADNGIGIEENRLKQIFNSKQTEHIGHTTGIGLNNVKERLKIFYNSKKELLKIHSIKGLGTKIILIFPK